MLGRDGHNGRERKTETGRASHAKPSGEERYRAPRQKKRERIEQRKQRGRKGPPKKPGMCPRVQAQLLCPAPSKTSRNTLGPGCVGRGQQGHGHRL